MKKLFENWNTHLNEEDDEELIEIPGLGRKTLLQAKQRLAEILNLAARDADDGNGKFLGRDAANIAAYYQALKEAGELE